MGTLDLTIKNNEKAIHIDRRIFIIFYEVENEVCSEQQARGGAIMNGCLC